MKAKSIGLVVFLSLVLGGAGVFVALSGGDGSEEGKTVAVEVQPEQPLAGETATISGRLGPAGRPVALQRSNAGNWVTLTKADSGEGGKFSFRVPATDAATTYRVEGAQARLNGEQLTLRRSTAFVLGGVQPNVTLLLGAPIGQSRDGTESLTLAEAVVSPPREGAAVAIERTKDGRWTELAAGKQDARGHFAFVLPAAAAEAPDSLRAVTTLIKGGTPIISAVGAKPSYEMVWNDEFDGDTLAEHWYSAPALTSLRPCTSTSLETTEVRDGTVRISTLLDTTKPKSKECPKGWFLNTQLTTEKSKTFTYGMFAARVKAQSQRGMHGGWWLFNLPEPDPGGDPKDARSLGIELDALEYFGDDDVKGGLKGAPQASLYFYTPDSDGKLKLNKRGGRQDVSQVVGNDKVSEQFHIFSVEWTPDAVIFRMDGKETLRQDDGLSTRGLYLLLSMLTSPFETDYLDPDELPATMEVDWVRVWQKPAA